MSRVLVALGGNALARAGGSGSWDEATDRMRATVPHLAALAADGHELILTHGNGPQVGALLRENELGEREVPPRPMDVLGAETQGQIGYLIQQELAPALRAAGVERTVLTVVSRVEVSRRDPAFRRPTKPVGRYYADHEARLLRKRLGWSMVYDGARGGWRRLVPSPAPLAWLERDAVRHLLSGGGGGRWVPVVTGGGGVPVVARARGTYEGVEAVIDKDRTAALVAVELGVDTLAIVTDVPGVSIGFRRPWERWLGEVSSAEMHRYLSAGEFGEGSMAPKVGAALEFLSRGGKRVVVTDIPSLGRGLRGEAGTRIFR